MTLINRLSAPIIQNDLGKRITINLFILTETITPWVLGALAIILTVLVAASAKSWHEMKRSPYFFLRRQAEKRLQTYLPISLIMTGLIVSIGLYAWRSPEDTVVRSAILANAKPPTADVIELIEGAPVVSAPVLELELLTETADTFAFANQPFGIDTELFDSAVPELPAEFDRFEPTAELRDETALGTIAFSTEIDDDYQAINPRQIFPEGEYTLYATFSYDQMVDGLEWAWVWRRDGEVLEGGNELWKYGNDGPGYIFFGPPEGFAGGEYTLDVWVNGQMFTQGSVVVNSAGVTAGN